jgi:hypothetical protein
MFMSRAGLGTNIACAGEDQQKFSVQTQLETGIFWRKKIKTALLTKINSSLY